MQSLLTINNLHASIEGHEVLKGVNLSLNPGEVHALMGPNGSGKSSLALTLLGHPNYVVSAGTIEFDGQDITILKPDDRARRGIFLTFQNPTAIPGVSVANLTRTAYKNIHRAKHVDVKTFRSRVESVMKELHLSKEFLDRSVNDGFSGGEKKQSEILQMSVLEPKLVILDEPDSGLDIDALKRIADAVNGLRDGKRTFLIITHYQRLLDYITPDVVHVFVNGKIVKTGGSDVAKELEQAGYQVHQSV